MKKIKPTLIKTINEKEPTIVNLYELKIFNQYLDNATYTFTTKN